MPPEDVETVSVSGRTLLYANDGGIFRVSRFQSIPMWIVFKKNPTRAPQ